MTGTGGTRGTGGLGGSGGANLQPGTELSGRYAVLRHLGSGGMGAVYEVRDRDLEEEVALKLLHPNLSNDTEYRSRLRSEVRLARRVSHPNVCRVHDLGSHEGQLFVTMELIRGVTLRSKLRAIGSGTAQPLPLPRRIDIVVQLCSALSAAHRAGVLHRDVKPDNVILEQERVVLSDFGVASPTAGVGGKRMLVGTPAYMAPEMLRGEAFDERIDVYAAALIAYELIAGCQAFDTPTLEAAAARARQHPVLPRFPDHLETTPATRAVYAALAAATEPDPLMRTMSIDLFGEQLAQAARSADMLTPPTDGTAPRVATSDAPTIAASARLRGAPRPRHARSTARAQVRIATALHFYCTPIGDATIAREALGLGAPEPQAVELSRVEELLDRIVVDLGGTPLETSATSITALFGAPVSLGDDAARAAKCAQALVDQTADGRAGIDTARILLRPGETRVPRASGDALDHAELLAHSAGPGQIRLSPQTARQLAGRFRVEEITTPSHQDIDRALVLQRELEGIDAPRHQRPMLGRRRELATLEQLVKQACEQRVPHWATVVAPAGLGKSRLRVELMRRVDERREVTWLVGRAEPLGGVAPLSLLGSSHPEWGVVADSGSLRDKASMFANARQWLERRAERRPVVVLLEDAQWADETSLEFFDDLRRSLAALPIAIITFLRPQATEAGGRTQAGDANPARILELGLLGSGDAETIARTLAPLASNEDILDIVQRAAGNPFFVEELARDVRERGARPTAQQKPLPATVEAVVQTRLDRLSPIACEIACAAAVVGVEFWRNAARAGLSPSEEIDDRQLDEALAELERRSIIAARPPSTVDDDLYVFHNALVRDVAYRRLGPSDRKRAHAAIGAWLARQAHDLTTAPPALVGAIAQHRDSAGDVAGARDTYRIAGEHALRLFAYRTAAQSLQRARDLTGEPSARLLRLLGDALSMAETPQAGERAYREALSRTDEPLLQAQLWQLLGDSAARQAEYQDAITRIETGLDIVTTDGAPNALGRTHPATTAALLGNLGWVLGYVLNDNTRGLRYGEAGVALLQHKEHRRDLALALGRLGANYMRAGRWQDQLRCNEQNLVIATDLGDLSLQLTARINLGVCLQSMGDLSAAITHTERALDLCAQTNATTTACLVQNNLAGQLIDGGEVERAHSIIQIAIRGAEQLGYRRILPEAYVYSARILAARGSLEAAERQARNAVNLAAETGPSIDDGIAARILAAVLAQRGQLDEADAFITRSHASLRNNDLYESARSDVVWARIAAARGDEAAASDRRTSARRILQSLGAKRDLAVMDDAADIR